MNLHTCGRGVVGLLLLLSVAGRCNADEAAILQDIGSFFSSADAGERETIARRIEADPAYERDKVSDWLHQAGLFEPYEAGNRPIDVLLPDGDTRTVIVRVPKDYDAARPYPLLYCLHGQSGDATQILRYFERLLGDRLEDFLLAAPDRYDEAVIHHTKWPPTGEHPRALLEIKRSVHVDSDRVFVAGYSRGGHTSWTLAVLHADQFAGALPVAGTFLMAEIDKLWEPLLANLQNTHVLCVWGENDTAGNSGTDSKEGGIAGVNRMLRDTARSLGTPLTAIEIPGKGHGGIVPPRSELDELLSRTRAHYPASVHSSFRHPYQASAYWIEGATWTGKAWDDRPPELIFKPGENPNDLRVQRKALERYYRSKLGEIRGTIDGQTLDVRRKNVREVYVWIGEGMIDWRQPVLLRVSGRKRFERRVTPDLFVCLSQAVRTRDFDRLRWAGLHFKSGSRVKPITGLTVCPPTGVAESEHRGP